MPYHVNYRLTLETAWVSSGKRPGYFEARITVLVGRLDNRNVIEGSTVSKKRWVTMIPQGQKKTRIYQYSTICRAISRLLGGHRLS